MARKGYFLTELDQEHTITFLLIRRKYNDTGEIVVVIGHLFLSKNSVNARRPNLFSTIIPLKRNQEHDPVASRRR
jgi:hypothetical protein